MGERQMSNIAVIEQDIFALRPHFESIAVDRSMSFEREAGFAVQVIAGSDYMLKVASGNRQSVIDAVTNVAAIGVSLNPAKKQAYLVPRKGKVCLDISYMGLLDMAMAMGSIRWAQAALVYQADIFLLNGYDKAPTHQYDPFSANRGMLTGVYVVVKTADGDYLTHCMSINDVYAIRNRSEAWMSGRANPWKTDEGEMVKKTCVKQAYKYWPKTERLQNAIQYLNTDGDEGLADLSGMPEVAPAKPRRASEAHAALPEPTAPVVLEPVIPADRVEELPVQPAASPATAPARTAAPDTGEPASVGECANVIKTAIAKKIDLAGLLAEMGIDLDPATLTGLTKSQFKALKARL
jgi:recombination protein RecT